MLSNNMHSVITEVIDEENEKLKESAASIKMEVKVVETPLIAKEGI